MHIVSGNLESSVWGLHCSLEQHDYSLPPNAHLFSLPPPHVTLVLVPPVSSILSQSAQCIDVGGLCLNLSSSLVLSHTNIDQINSPKFSFLSLLFGKMFMLIVDRHECWTELGSLKAQIHSICLFVQLHTRLSVHGARQAPEKQPVRCCFLYPSTLASRGRNWVV